MFERIQTQAGLTFYRSPLLAGAGVPHGFSTRHDDHQAECDLATVTSPASADAGISPAYGRFLQAIGCGGLPLVHLRQVHGNAVHLVDHADAGHPRDADGLVAVTPGVALSIRMADCVPILLSAVDPRENRPLAVSAVHAGWRGLVAGILPQAVRTLRQQPGLASARLLAAIGPCISCEHFEVGPEVAAAFDDAGLEAAIIPPGIPGTPGNSPGIPNPKPHIDLPLAAKLHLLSAGLAEGDIDLGGLCTYANPGDFYSHRRDHGQTGRLAAVIALPGILPGGASGGALPGG